MEGVLQAAQCIGPMKAHRPGIRGQIDEIFKIVEHLEEKFFLPQPKDSQGDTLPRSAIDYQAERLEAIQAKLLRISLEFDKF